MDPMTPAQFYAAFPAFKNTPVSDVQRHLDDADRLFDIPRWGADYLAGIGNVVAHLIVIESKGALFSGVAGDITEKQVGSVRIVRSPVLMSKMLDNPFNRTIYGQTYLYYARRVGIGAIATANTPPLPIPPFSSINGII
jgi:hypothetical protein